MVSHRERDPSGHGLKAPFVARPRGEPVQTTTWAKRAPKPDFGIESRPKARPTCTSGFPTKTNFTALPTKPTSLFTLTQSLSEPRAIAEPVSNATPEPSNRPEKYASVEDAGPVHPRSEPFRLRVSVESSGNQKSRSMQSEQQVADQRTEGVEKKPHIRSR
ncbi:hypothetical protein BKA66DRAFT_438853 [Pyrenochaeta sp. MPI-SDFR-AT-0127]|nr:hypothetical protein BKA66DRAFT_438853 [Pyrenochaeta sp. MPI-SDFR-AT-0127]